MIGIMVTIQLCCSGWLIGNVPPCPDSILTPLFSFVQMSHFDHTVEHDQAEIIPFLLAALQTSSFPLRLVASPWSPPGWMKVPLLPPPSSPPIPPSADIAEEKSDDEDEDDKGKGGKKKSKHKDTNETTSRPMTMTSTSSPNGLIASPEVMAAWALYISLFIDAYASLQVPIWAVTPQNEPEFAAPWEACAYNASFERAFIDEYLGPRLQADHPEVRA